MKKVLHVLTRPEDKLAMEIIAKQGSRTGAEIEAVDLTVPKPDYKILLEKIFASDSIQLW